ncbi:MAG TPA: hypothetical protein PLL20_10675 [Phycisphaerae bacterium]|nr:hypothetical protein [Phycisphaerae bacterium]HRR85504.1 hypothetical protein [Phycisphaerae bacterium]
MKRARTLLLAAGVGGLLAAGCNNGQLQPLWPAWGQTGKHPEDAHAVSQPTSAMPPASAPAEETEETSSAADAKMAAVSQRIEEYLTRVQQALTSAPQSRPAGEPPRPSATRPTRDKTIEGTTPSPKPPALAVTSRPAGKANAAIAIDPQEHKSDGPPSPMTAVMAAPARGPRVELVDVRPAIRPSQPTASAQSSAAANRPTTGEPSGPMPMDTAAMIAYLEDVVARHPEQLDDQLKLRLLYLATGQDEKAVAPLNIGDPVRAEFVIALLKTLRNSKKMIVDPASKDPSALAAVDELRRLLGQQLPVSIPRIALVTRINSFGDYLALNPPKFPAGKPVQVFLYTEVNNFRSEPTDDGKLQTILSQKVEIFDSSGKIVWQRSEPNIVDRVVTPRQDFFIPFPINLPDDLPAGEYILKVTIEDRLGATTDQQKLTFTVGQ